MVVGIIPARYAATRLPGKPLIDLCGQTMIERVWRGASEARLVDRLIIATDDHRVIDAAGGFGAEAVMTDPALASGTDRCHAVVEVLDEELEIVINIQGDEPLLPGELLDDLVTALRLGDADVATPISRIDHIDDVFDENIVKVVVAPSGLAVYFSRSPVPFLRGVERGQWLEHQRYWKHLGIYAYTPDALRRHVTLPVSALERAESLEQLRTLEDGVRFRCVATEATMISVDVESDAERVRKLISEQ